MTRKKEASTDLSAQQESVSGTVGGAWVFQGADRVSVRHL